MIGGFTLPIAPASPSLFTVNDQLAAINEDGTINGPIHPAKARSIVSVFMTGGVGAYNVDLAGGAIGPLTPPFPTPVLGVGAAVGSPLVSFGLPGEPAQVLFASQAPGLVAGAVQVNLRVPADIPAGNAPLRVYVGNYATPFGPQYVSSPATPLLQTVIVVGN